MQCYASWATTIDQICLQDAALEDEFQLGTGNMCAIEGTLSQKRN